MAKTIDLESAGAAIGNELAHACIDLDSASWAKWNAERKSGRLPMRVRIGRAEGRPGATADDHVGARRRFAGHVGDEIPSSEAAGEAEHRAYEAVRIKRDAAQRAARALDGPGKVHGVSEDAPTLTVPFGDGSPEHQAAHVAMQKALDQHDLRQFRAHMKNPQRRYYNPFAKALYREGLARIDADVKRGIPLRQAIIRHTEDEILDTLLKAIKAAPAARGERF